MDSWQPGQTLRPVTERTVDTVWTEYASALSQLPGSPLERITMLQGLLADVSARLETGTRDSISQALLEYARQSDQPVLRSRPTGPRSPQGQERPASSPQRAPWELMVGTSRLGPRLAGKLVLASARAASRRR